MDGTIGIHWTATTHGTWLHGDPRGSWKHGRLIGPDPYLRAECEAKLVDRAVKLSSYERDIVATVFGHITREQGHRVFAGAIQATHIHLILSPLAEDTKPVISRFKRRSAAAVLDHRRRSYSPNKTKAIPRSIWTIGQFPVFIFDEFHLANAIEYVRDHNRRVGLLSDPFDWITPLFPACDIAGDRLRDGEAVRL